MLPECGSNQGKIDGCGGCVLCAWVLLVTCLCGPGRDVCPPPRGTFSHGRKTCHHVESTCESRTAHTIHLDSLPWTHCEIPFSQRIKDSVSKSPSSIPHCEGKEPRSSVTIISRAYSRKQTANNPSEENECVRATAIHKKCHKRCLKPFIEPRVSRSPSPKQVFDSFFS